MQTLSGRKQEFCPFRGGVLCSSEEAFDLLTGGSLDEESYLNLIFSLLWQPPKMDALSLTWSDLQNMEEDVALALYDKLEECRKATYEAYKRSARAR